MSRCGGIAGWILGHRFEEIVDEEAEYYEITDPLLVLKCEPGVHNHGPTKKSSRTHLYVVCMRCGEKVIKERQSLFTKEDK